MKRKTTKLRELFASDDLLVVSSCYDALSAIIQQEAGLRCIGLSGNTSSASVLGKPDLGIMTLTEMTTRARAINEVIDIPMLADADTGFGGVHNIMQTVRAFESAGCAGIHIEDQVFPKRCGFMKGVAVVPVEEAVMRFKAAVQAKTDPDFVIVARTDARTPYDVDEAIRRANLYLEAGADMAYVEGLKSLDEIIKVGREVKGLLYYSATEYRPWTNISRKDIKKYGFKIANYPMTLTLTICKTMMDTMKAFVECDNTQELSKGMARMNEDYNRLLKLSGYFEIETGIAEACKQ